MLFSSGTEVCVPANCSSTSLGLGLGPPHTAPSGSARLGQTPGLSTTAQVSPSPRHRGCP